MGKTNSKYKWIEIGYGLFAKEGLEGIQVERLSRITRLNKAGYYHYFGDREFYLENLIEHHLNYAKEMANDFKQVKDFDPQFIEVLIKYTNSIMFHNQLVRNRELNLLSDTYRQVNDIVDPIVIKLFTDFLGLQNQPQFSSRYYFQVRDKFYSQITFELMNYPFLLDFLRDARELIQSAFDLGAKEIVKNNLTR